MIAKKTYKTILLTVALVGISAGHVQADKLALQEKLSKELKIQLKDVTIAEALEKIGQKAGLKFVLSDEAAWKLSNAEATRLSVALQGPLAESMTEMLNAFFMRYAVGDEEITIYPRPELEHILGRPTTKQLELLKAIYTSPILVYYLEQVQKTINEALGQEVLISPMHVQAQLNNLLRQLVGKDPIYEQKRRDSRGRQGPPAIIKKGRESEPSKPEPTEFRLPTPVTLVQLLSQVSAVGGDLRDTRWYISRMVFGRQTPEIRVVDSVAFTRLKLNQKIDISYKEERLDKIMQDLANRAGIKLITARGSYLNEHKLSVNMQNITIEQAVINIADIVGAVCEIRYEIQISGPGKPKSKTSALMPKPSTAKSGGRPGGDEYIGKISIPMDGGKYFIEFMLRESDLTEQLKKLRAEKMKEVLGEPPKPAEKPKNK